INFHNWPIEEARSCKEIFDIIVQRVKPQRDLLPDYKKRVRDNWWLYEYQARNLYEAASQLSRILVIARTSRTAVPTSVTPNHVLDAALVAFPTDRSATLSLLTSAAHISWVLRYCSSLKGDLRYTPSDGFETFPQPRLTEQLGKAGETLYKFRREIMG